MEHTMNKALFFIPLKLTCFFLEKNRISYLHTWCVKRFSNRSRFWNTRNVNPLDQIKTLYHTWSQSVRSRRPGCVESSRPRVSQSEPLSEYFSRPRSQTDPNNGPSHSQTRKRRHPFHSAGSVNWHAAQSETRDTPDREIRSECMRMGDARLACLLASLFQLLNDTAFHNNKSPLSAKHRGSLNRAHRYAFATLNRNKWMK